MKSKADKYSINYKVKLKSLGMKKLLQKSSCRKEKTRPLKMSLLASKEERQIFVVFEENGLTSAQRHHKTECLQKVLHRTQLEKLEVTQVLIGCNWFVSRHNGAAASASARWQNSAHWSEALMPKYDYADEEQSALEIRLNFFFSSWQSQITQVVIGYK